MKLLTGTGVALVLAFAVGVFAGIAWLMIAPLILTLVWSVVADRTTRQPHGWYRS